LPTGVIRIPNIPIEYAGQELIFRIDERTVPFGYHPPLNSTYVKVTTHQVGNEIQVSGVYLGLNYCEWCCGFMYTDHGYHNGWTREEATVRVLHGENYYYGSEPIQIVQVEILNVGITSGMDLLLRKVDEEGNLILSDKAGFEIVEYIFEQEYVWSEISGWARHVWTVARESETAYTTSSQSDGSGWITGIIEKEFILEAVNGRMFVFKETVVPYGYEIVNENFAIKILPGFDVGDMTASLDKILIGRLVYDDDFYSFEEYDLEGVTVDIESHHWMESVTFTIDVENRKIGSFDMILEVVDCDRVLITSDRATFDITRVLTELRSPQVGDFVNFTPTVGSHTVPAALSGHTTDQHFTTQNLQWQIKSLDNGQITLISSTPTTSSLVLRRNSAEGIMQ